jgi:peptidyl-tRNA hydrolase, PTH1 family
MTNLKSKNTLELFFILKSMTLIIPKLIVGLGNPGDEYKHTRHNIGFEAIDAFAKAWQIPMVKSNKFKGEVNTKGFILFNNLILLKPSIGVNLSGQVIRAVVDWYKLPPTSILVIYDDMDLPLGRLRLRLSGSAKGHNGMKSTISHLGTQDFPRLRIGIGKPKSMSDSISHVLGRFDLGELPVVEQSLIHVRQAITISFNRGIEFTMNQCNNFTLEK